MNRKMDQTVVFTTLIGGTLAIVGGFLATWYTQFINNRAEKTKIIREKIEEIYLLINEIEDNIVSSILELKKHIDTDDMKALDTLKDELLLNVMTYNKRIQMIANIYLKGIVEQIEKHCAELHKCYVKIAGIIDDRIFLYKLVAENRNSMEKDSLKVIVSKVAENDKELKTILPQTMELLGSTRMDTHKAIIKMLSKYK